MDFFVTHVSERSRVLAGEVLASEWLSEGAKVREFEAALASRLGLASPVCVNSGTSALHLSLAVAGVGPGDEVIIPAQTFVATGLAVLMVGATPVFADINPRTGNISPLSVQGRITDRTRAVIPVHWAGYPCDMAEILEVCRDNQIAVIEDAAHALGAEYRGRPVGSLSRFTCFSFQAIKHLTTGDGGALCCLDEGDASRARAIRWFGIDRAKSKPSLLGEREFDLTELGFKYHMNDVAAAIGLGNIETLEGRLARRREIATIYRRELSHVPGLALLDSSPDRIHAYWLFTVLVENRAAFIRKLASQGIPSSVVHLRIDRYSIFGGIRDSLPGQDDFESRQVAIPVHERLSGEQVESVIGAIRAGW